jgi:uncharacterized membrane protein
MILCITKWKPNGVNQMEDPATLIMIAKGIATGLVVLTVLFIWAYVDTIIALHYEEKE